MKTNIVKKIILSSIVANLLLIPSIVNANDTINPTSSLINKIDLMKLSGV